MDRKEANKQAAAKYRAKLKAAGVKAKPKVEPALAPVDRDAVNTRRRELRAAAIQQARAASIYQVPLSDDIKTEVQVFLDNRSIPYTCQQIIDLSRGEDTSEGQVYQYLSHDFVFTKSALHWYFKNTQVLGFCQCCYTDEKCKDLAPHFHVLTYHPNMTNDTVMRRVAMVMPLREPGFDGETLMMNKNPPHRMTTTIRCEHHLVMVMHYISCQTASKSSFSRGSHKHCEPMVGPVARHAITKKDPSCSKLKRDLKERLGVRHNFLKCTCTDGAGQQQKFAAAKIKTWKKKGEKLLGEMAERNVKVAEGIMITDNFLKKSLAAITEPEPGCSKDN